MSKVRFQMFLEEDQKEMLERLQKDSNIPIAEIIRKAIDKLLVESKEKKKILIESEITQRLLSVAGVCGEGPKDLADQHDWYLYGISRK
ncbi:MAG TPA: ribbon-helix-helix domain-containing protein [Candidatus Brocadiales bacterium]|nr:ribbon-helix-helix domain-containing protein [Candidatus Brocadiales bacterium]